MAARKRKTRRRRPPSLDPRYQPRDVVGDRAIAAENRLRAIQALPDWDRLVLMVYVMLDHFSPTTAARIFNLLDPRLAFTPDMFKHVCADGSQRDAVKATRDFFVHLDERDPVAQALFGFMKEDVMRVDPSSVTWTLKRVFRKIGEPLSEELLDNGPPEAEAAEEAW